MKLDPQGRPYFIDHINKRTTYEDPRTPRAASQPQAHQVTTVHSAQTQKSNSNIVLPVCIYS